MSRSTPELGLLELQRLLIRERAASPRTVDVFDLDTGEKVGVAREMPGAWESLLRWLLGRRLGPARIRVYETEDESLVFTVRWPVGRQRVEVYDAEDHLVGYLRRKFLGWDGGSWVYDYRGRLFAEVRGKPADWDFAFLTPGGRDLGTVTRRRPGQERFPAADAYVFSLADELEDQPIAKMLLLAAALAINLVSYEGKQ